MFDSVYTNKLIFADIEKNHGLKIAANDSSSQICKKIEDARLRGLSGAGFLIGLKWKLALEQEDEQKFIICNADEGEPGSFKDKEILIKYADLVIEGLTIGAKAIGATKGYLYLRWEYFFLKNKIEDIIHQRYKSNLLGNNILQVDDFNFDLEIRMGAGAYICGEETALIKSLEGFRGEPSDRPPYPVTCGLHNHVTVVNNVETLAWATSILSKGSTWYKKIGTEKSSGLHLLCISGDCNRPGVYEVPMGITVTQALEHAKTNISATKGALLGGAQGIFLPKKDFFRKICYEDLFICGPIIVFHNKRNLLDISENILRFFIDESCGVCSLCRLGNPALLQGIKKIKDGTSTYDDIDFLFSLSSSMKLGNKCGLGKSSPKALLSLLENFKNEYTHLIHRANNER